MRSPIIKASFPEFISKHQKLVYSINFSERYSQFQISATRVDSPIYHHAHPNILNQLFISMNLYQYAKNQTISSLCSGDIVDLKTLPAHWPVTFGTFFKNQNFPRFFQAYIY